MMKRKIIYVSLAFQLFICASFAQWEPVKGRIMTSWGENVSPDNVLPEYPRPLMERKEWSNLNGLWDFAITSTSERKPADFEKQILVPFPIESALSGVGKTVGYENVAWYSRNFTVPSAWRQRNQRILLHFGAVDWRTEVWINDIFVGTHQGGYTAFHYDITPFLNRSANQNVVVRVWDPTDKGPQPRGKQVTRPYSIWYTAVTGIWQTVWMEPVPEKYISNIKITPDIDNNRVLIKPQIAFGSDGDIVKAEVIVNNSVVATGYASATQALRLLIDSAELWSPDNPFLYDLRVTLLNDNKQVDQVNSYFAMRKISTHRDEGGNVRFQLNNEDIVLFGLLDQGYWPDGLYTAPADEALKYDIQKAKDLGYNMLRKHVKVEPARWYTHADRIGMLVWQDMPNGDSGPEWQRYNYFTGNEFIRTPESEQIFRTELKAMIDLLYSNPSVVVWIPFNERWGQFKTPEITEWIKTYDPSRLVMPASGGNHYPVGDILSLHNYPEPRMFLFDGQRANVVGEYGGIGLVIQGHLWEPEHNWGYVQASTKEELMNIYVKYADMVKNLIKAGFAGAVYTQITDVEIEVNGLMTYDRKVLKVDKEKMKNINKAVINVLKTHNK